MRTVKEKVEQEAHIVYKGMNVRGPKGGAWRIDEVPHRLFTTLKQAYTTVDRLTAKGAVPKARLYLQDLGFAKVIRRGKDRNTYVVRLDDMHELNTYLDLNCHVINTVEDEAIATQLDDISKKMRSLRQEFLDVKHKLSTLRSIPEWVEEFEKYPEFDR